MKYVTLATWLNYLESAHSSEIDLGLERVRIVAARLQLFSPAKRVIMVGGTNGKGSTVTMCASILRAAGLSVGSYMSPHLHIYNERIVINGEFVSDADLMESFQAIEDARGEISLTYFEVGTLSAFYVFKKYQLDVAVVEVGLGGRLDAVNIIDADVSIVTSIGLDHMDWLGDNLESIAYEKAGIYRAGMPSICGQRQPQKPLVDHCLAINSALFVKGQEFDYSVNSIGWDWHGRDAQGLPIQLNGLPLPTLPIENAATTLQALMLFAPSLRHEQIVSGLNKAVLPGRLQRYKLPINLILDVGHNAQAAGMLNQYLSNNPIKGKRYALLAMLIDKDPASVVKQMQSCVSEWHIAGLDGYRGQSVLQLDKKLSGLVNTVCHQTVRIALDELNATMNADDELIVFGSFMTVAQAQDWLKEQ